ncbi:F-box protein At3g07870-like [Hordeum vulgare subsp. vulgare]|uniref:F-box domain-containing protein n=1 Tax=Hordeum vulgare subsp. vulgare TaxID=112509 RepID=A0A8I6X753_HORVV|nr:F-box protein At3g07870-like [Hordeum vulgare subsp. vulgare]
MVSEEACSKKERNEECFINCLTRDLIERIFFRLPVSTLLVCVGVCAHWKTLIRDPNFVTSHLKHASHYSFIFFQKDYAAGKNYPSDAILIDKAGSQSTYAVPTIDPDDFLCGSCNGIICLYTNRSTIKIANLATGECLHLEKPTKNLSGDQSLFYSFGFHPLTREYKITHLVGDYVEERPQNGDKFTMIQVYKLGDEKWKDIRTPEALSLTCIKNSGLVNVGGTMYWLTDDMAASSKHVVMCFDLGEEAFSQIQLPTPVPEICVHGGPRRYWIREIDGKICIATSQTWHKVVYGKL